VFEISGEECHTKKDTMAKEAVPGTVAREEIEKIPKMAVPMVVVVLDLWSCGNILCPRRVTGVSNGFLGTVVLG
jgi:hypothetical protein